MGNDGAGLRRLEVAEAALGDEQGGDVGFYAVELGERGGNGLLLLLRTTRCCSYCSGEIPEIETVAVVGTAVGEILASPVTAGATAVVVARSGWNDATQSRHRLDRRPLLGGHGWEINLVINDMPSTTRLLLLRREEPEWPRVGSCAQGDDLPLLFRLRTTTVCG